MNDDHEPTPGPAPARVLGDEQVEQALGNLLRTGVVLAALVVLAGGVLYLARHGGEPADRRTFQGEPAELRSPAGIVSEALALHERMARELWQRAGYSGHWKYPFTRLVERYGESGRHYHTLAHVQQCLETFDALRDDAENPDAVEMALWFHDAVYDTRKKDNEAMSAGLAEVVLDVGGFPTDYIALVRRLVLATTHRDPPNDADEAVLIDCDLAVTNFVLANHGQCHLG